jgi:hypothetical protein
MITVDQNTGCNIIRYTTLKIYCDQTNSNITTQFVIEHLLTLQVLRHLKPSTHGHHYVACCSHPSKWHTLLMSKCVLQFEQNHSATLVQRWFHRNYGKEAPMRKSIYKWHKSFAETGCICAKKNNSGR